MKSAAEYQAERHRAALARIAAEDAAAAERIAAAQARAAPPPPPPPPPPTAATRNRPAEPLRIATGGETSNGREIIAAERAAAEGETTECCGAPIDGQEPNPKYWTRHRRGYYGTPPELCDQAIQTHNLYHRARNPLRRIDPAIPHYATARIARDKADPARTECCGAPRAGDEPTGKYAGRHYNEGTRPCRAARNCRNGIYRATKRHGPRLLD